MFRIILKRLREENGLSQSTLASILNKGQSAVGMWESGKSYPDYLTLMELAKFFNVSVSYLTGETTTKEKTPSEEGVALDDFTYALYDETKDLTEEDKKMLLGMAKMLKERKDKEK